MMMTLRFLCFARLPWSQNWWQGEIIRGVFIRYIYQNTTHEISDIGPHTGAFSICSVLNRMEHLTSCCQVDGLQVKMGVAASMIKKAIVLKPLMKKATIT